MSERSGERPLVVVANRLPVSEEDGQWRPSAGGLVTAMRPVVEERGGDWIGWDGGAGDVPRRVEGFNAELHPVSLSRAQVQGYYYGFANRTLWPLCHDLVEDPIIDRGWWRTYQEVNQHFADAVGDISSAGEQPLFWVHDYHLMLAPEMIRQKHPDAPIGFFLHIPFPPPELMARLPWREEILRGLLAADGLGFHTERYRDNFVRLVEWIVDDVEVDGKTVRLPDGRTCRTEAHPISIDVGEFEGLARDEETESHVQELRQQFAGRRIFLGVDRLDYTKGIRHRLQAIELLLERNPDLRDHFAFIQIAVPSRDDVKEYQELRTEVETEVGRINGRFTEPGEDVPVHYLYRSVDKNRLVAYYRLADVMCVTPLKDGMNLVAKEFVTTQNAADGSGVLLLSEFTGATLEFRDRAVTCNPFDVEGLSLRMQACLELEEDDRRQRLAVMADRVRGADVFDWVRDELSSVEWSYADAHADAGA